MYRVDGKAWRSRVQVYDAPFSTERTDGARLHVNSVLSRVPSLKAQPLFDDTRSYWDPAIPQAGVKLPGVGVKIRVLEQGSSTMRIRLS
jgi:immune inhibitor A